MSMISAQTTHGFDTRDPAQVHSISEQLAAFTTSLSLSEIPSPVIQHAKLHILDAVGVGLAASRFDFALRACRWARGKTECQADDRCARHRTEHGRG
nr:hypothetical protein [Gammaproteobacteria bacterium]